MRRRCSPRPAGWAGKGLYPRTLTHLIGQTATKPGSKSNACRRGNFRLSGSSRIRRALPRSTSASMKGKIWSTWARSAPARPEQSPARSGNSSKRWSARNPSSRNQSANLRPPRLSRRSLPTLSIGTLRRKGCFAKARLKVSSGTENAHRRFYIRRPDLQFGRQRRAVCLRSMEQGPRASRF
jgi:hypothetical protein